MKVKIQLISISLVDCASTSTSASTSAAWLGLVEVEVEVEVESIELVCSKMVGSSSSRYRDRSVGSTKFAHIGKFKNLQLTF